MLSIAGGRNGSDFHELPITHFCAKDAVQLEAFLVPIADEFRTRLDELKHTLHELSGRVNEMNVNAVQALTEHKEMDRKVREHEMQIHGNDFKSGFDVRIDRLEQASKGWGKWITYFGAVGLVVLAYVLGRWH